MLLNPNETCCSRFQQLVHQFQSDPETRVAVLSILAAGVVSVLYYLIPYINVI